MSNCSFCGKETRKVSGLDFLGRVYCRRFLCRFKIWFDQKVRWRLDLIKKAVK